jgi:DNA primase
VIGFGARALDLGSANKGAKYINSPQTGLFDKSRTLYGLDLARQAIHREDRVVIVEGYMDVMQAHQAGFANVVAQMGTALTEPQLRQLQRYTQRLVLALDPDAAGIQATLRGVEVAQEVLDQEWKPVFDPRGLIGYEARLGAEIRVLQLPRGQDPDDLIRQSPQRWAGLVEDAKPVVEFYMQHLLASSDVDDPKVKKSIADAMLPILRSVSDPVERSAYGQKLARALKVSAPQFLHELERKARQTTARRGRETREKGGRGRKEQGAETRLSDMLETREADLESHCLSALLQRPTILSQVNQVLRENQLPPLQGQDFEGAGHRAIFETWEALLTVEPLASAEALYAQLPPDLQVRIEQLLAIGGDWLADEQLTRDITLTLLRLRERSLKRIGQELSLLTTEAQEAGDLRADQYAEVWLSHTEILLRTQQALAQQRGWMPRL